MNRSFAIAFVLFAMALAWLSYGIERPDFVRLIIAFSLMSGLMAAIYQIIKNENKNRTGIASAYWIAGAIVLRLVPLFSIPTLSDDFYRFIWDGMIGAQGISPFAYTPAELIQMGVTQPAISQVLFDAMNSPEYYSVYPAVCQALFRVAWFLGSENILMNIILLRLFIIAGEAATLLVMKMLLERLGQPVRHLVWYAFNPVVIMEFSGNLHLEALMLLFLLVTWLLLLRGKRYLSVIPIVLAIHVKLLPLMLLPWFLFRFGLKKGAAWISMVMMGSVVLFAPFMGLADLPGIAESLALYFRTFEFNAGLYYLLREIGYLVKGYNIIATLGPAMAATATILILMAAYHYRKLPAEGFALVAMATFSIHLFFATTVHPWYVLPVTGFAVFTGFRYSVVWSVLLPLSYHAYRVEPVTESVWLVLLSNFIVLLALLRDLSRKRVRTDV